MACGVASWRKSSSPRDILPCETPAHTPRTVVSARKSPHHQTVPAHTDGLIVARTARNKPAPFALRSAHPLPTCSCCVTLGQHEWRSFFVREILELVFLEKGKKTVKAVSAKAIRGPEPGAQVFEPLHLTSDLRAPTGRQSTFSFVFLCLSVCVALKLRSLHFTHPVYVASRYFQ